jgi:hypothetical protein
MPLSWRSAPRLRRLFGGLIIVVTRRLDAATLDWQERTAAQRAAWSVPGVVKVEDNLRIF